MATPPRLVTDLVRPLGTDAFDPDFSLYAEEVEGKALDIETDLLVWWVKGYEGVTYEKREDAMKAAQERYEALYG